MSSSSILELLRCEKDENIHTFLLDTLRGLLGLKDDEFQTEPTLKTILNKHGKGPWGVSVCNLI